MAYKPSMPFSTPFEVLTPTETQEKGVVCKSYLSDNVPRFCSFRTFGGNESTENGIVSVANTATLDAWYDPAITSACRLYFPLTGDTYDIIGTPEDIEQRHQWLRIRVEATKGGA